MKHETIQQKLVEMLRKDLSDVNDDTLLDIARIVSGNSGRQSMDQIAFSLLSSNISIGRILTVLLRCEWKSMQQLMLKTAASENLKEQIHLFSDIVHHFNALQAAVIRGADQRWHKMLEGERKFKVLAESKIAWLTSKKVHLHNYFREMPVSAIANILNVEGESLWVTITPEVMRVFSVSEDEKTALIISSDHAYNIIAAVSHCSDHELCLSVRDIVPVLREKRDNVRIEPDEEVIVQIIWKDKIYTSSVSDISCGGLGVKISFDVDIREGDDVRCQLQLNKGMYDLKGLIKWHRHSGNNHFFGITLELERKQKSEIYRYIFEQQQAIAERLHRLTPPPWVQGA